MGISREVWANHIEGNLFKNNDFILGGTDDSQYVEYKTVHLPNAGSVPVVTKDLALGGARQNSVQRVDTPVDYNIHTYFAMPWLISEAEKAELSYSKRDSLLSEMQSKLNQQTAEDIIYAWAATGLAGTNNILRTTGFMNNDVNTSVAAAYDLNNPAAGNRKVFTLFDLKAARLFLNNQDCPQEDRHMLLPSNLIDQLINDLTATKYRGTIGDVFDLSTGTVKKIMGFNIYERSTGQLYDNSALPVPKAVGAMAANTDNQAALFWQRGGVSYGKGMIKVRYNADQADAFGDLMSAEVRFGGSKRRLTETKVGAIVQAVAA